MHPLDLVDACGEDPSWLCEEVFEATSNEGLAGVVDWLVGRPLKILVIVIVAVIANRLVRRGIRKMVDRLQRDREAAEVAARAEASGLMSSLGSLASRRLDEIHEQTERSKQRAVTLGSVCSGIATGLIYGLAGLIVLGELNVNLGPLIAGAGIAGIAFGFGAQSLVKDFVTGVFLLAEDQYGVGDVVNLGEVEGTVESVSLRVTRVRDIQGTLWFVPNGLIERVGNFSQLWARVVLDVDVAYDTDIERASEVIKRVADELWREELDGASVLEEPRIWGVQAFGPDAISIRLVVKTDPGEQWATERQLRQRLKQAFDAEGIEIPFPQRTVWLHTESS